MKNNIYRIIRSDRNPEKLISHRSDGKVILIQNQRQVHAGYAKIEEFEERDKFIIAKMKNVAVDFYHSYNDEDTIGLVEFEEVLKNFGFTLQYEEPIRSCDKMLVYANINTGALIKIETYNDCKTYNSVELYIMRDIERYMKYDHISDGNRAGLHSSCTSGLYRYEIMHCKLNRPLKSLLEVQSKENGLDWKGNTPSLWHYDNHNLKVEDFVECDKKLYSFKDPIHEIFNMRVKEEIKRMEANI